MNAIAHAFMPLLPDADRVHETSFIALARKGAGPATETTSSIPDSSSCAAPVITLQRKGDVISGIRIQCGCGKVVDLTCVF